MPLRYCTWRWSFLPEPAGLPVPVTQFQDRRALYPLRKEVPQLMEKHKGKEVILFKKAFPSSARQPSDCLLLNKICFIGFP